ncbi:hypothetical protein WA026_017958 [Henosepilachna vigintioctopunctata]|uniref:Luciferin 4-monooxygenase n=1 Tax=Henosepilachna vigintioctopunctata TaxID=420089 RepID=A0AAW1TXR1_9CUCU
MHQYCSMFEIPKQIVVQGLPSLKPIEEISTGEIIYRSLLSHNENHPALINGTTRDCLTYPDLLSKTCSLAEALRHAGYGQGTTILISSKNHLQFLVPIISALYIGATATAMNPSYTYYELEHLINISKPNIVFCSKEILEKYIAIKSKFSFIERIIVIDSPFSTLKADCLDDFIGRNIKSIVTRITTTPVNTREQVAFIMYSSGTTGLPKGVMMTHRNINAVFNTMQDPRMMHQDFRSLCVPPFFHAYGLLSTLSALSINKLTVFMTEFDPKVFLQSIQDYKLTRLFLPPAIVVFMAKSALVLQYDLSSIKETLCGAAPLKKSTEEELKRRLNVEELRQGYGMTETSFAVTINGLGVHSSKPGSAGKVVPYTRIGIRDLNTGEFAGPNTLGEICIKGELVMKGYCGDPEATKNAFSDDGWLLTGDVGYYDEDGDFYITDRLKELIKYKGFQVPPAEIEALLLTHPDIIDCGVVGIEDPRAGEIPIAFVVKAENSYLTEKDVRKFVKGKLSPEKWLRGGVIFLEEIPKNPTGKVLRRELRKMVTQFKSKL